MDSEDTSETGLATNQQQATEAPYHNFKKNGKKAFGNFLAASSHNFRHEVAITVLTPAIAERAHSALA